MSATVFKADGDAAWRHGRWEDAAAAWSEALSVPGGCSSDLKATLYSNRSAAYLKLNNAQAALKDAEACVRLSPNWAKGHMRLGGAHLASNRVREAHEAFATAAALEPSNREYADAAADTKRQFTHAPPQPPPQQQQGYGQQQQQRGGGGGPMNIFADGMAWCVANQQMLLQGGLALFAVWYLMGGGMELGSILLLAGAVFAGHRAGMSPFQIMMMVNMLRGQQGGRRRGYGGYGGGGFGGLGGGGLGGFGGGMGGLGRRGW